MFSTVVSRKLSVDADTAWNLLVDWGNTAWIPGPEKTEVIENGDQVMRRMFIADMEPIEETMLANDPATKTIQYTIAVSQLFTLADYRGEIVVKEDTAGCCIDWHCAFDQAQMTDEEANQKANGNLNFLLDSLASYLQA